MADKKFITVCESGLIAGVDRKTCIPFEALEHADFNMMFPEEAEEKKFEVLREADLLLLDAAHDS